MKENASAVIVDVVFVVYRGMVGIGAADLGAVVHESFGQDSELGEAGIEGVSVI